MSSLPVCIYFYIYSVTWMPNPISLGQDGCCVGDKPASAAAATSSSSFKALELEVPNEAPELEGADPSATGTNANANRKQGAVYAAINRKTTFELQD